PGGTRPPLARLRSRCCPSRPPRFDRRAAAGPGRLHARSRAGVSGLRAAARPAGVRWRGPKGGLRMRHDGISSSILDAIGDTPLLEIDGVFAKLEFMNPSGSI